MVEKLDFRKELARLCAPAPSKLKTILRQPATLL
jgi:hypothetical protein